MANILNMVSIISFITAVVFVIIALGLWFLFKIPVVMGELSGRSAKKSIDKMRQDNEKTGKKINIITNEKQNPKSEKSTKKLQEIAKKSEISKEETGLLYENQTTRFDNQETGELVESETVDLNETVLLKVEHEKIQKQDSFVKLKLLDEVMYIHTDEEI